MALYYATIHLAIEAEDDREAEDLLDEFAAIMRDQSFVIDAWADGLPEEAQQEEASDSDHGDDDDDIPF